jgi:hypothetical protein
MYGAEKLQELVRHHIALGEWLAEQVKADSRCGRGGQGFESRVL